MTDHTSPRDGANPSPRRNRGIVVGAVGALLLGILIGCTGRGVSDLRPTSGVTVAETASLAPAPTVTVSETAAPEPAPAATEGTVHSKGGALTDGPLTVRIPSTWHVVRDELWDEDFFNDDKLTAWAGCSCHKGWAYLANSDFGTPEDLAERILRLERSQYAMHDDDPVPTKSSHVRLNGLAGFKLSATVSDYLIDGPEYRIDILIVTQHIDSSPYVLGGGPADRMTVLVTRSPLDDARAVSEVEQVWSVWSLPESSLGESACAADEVRARSGRSSCGR